MNSPSTDPVLLSITPVSNRFVSKPVSPFFNSASTSPDTHTPYSQDDRFRTRGGIGLVIHSRSKGFVVAGLIPGGPADLCRSIGINDILLAVDGIPVSQIGSCDEVSKRLIGPVGSTVVLLLQRSGNSLSELIEVTIERQRLTQIKLYGSSLEQLHHILLLQAPSRKLRSVILRSWALAVRSLYDRLLRLASRRCCRALRIYFHAFCSGFATAHFSPLLAEQRRIYCTRWLLTWVSAVRGNAMPMREGGDHTSLLTTMLPVGSFLSGMPAVGSASQTGCMLYAETDDACTPRSLER